MCAPCGLFASPRLLDAQQPLARNSSEIKVRRGECSAEKIGLPPHPSDGLHMRPTTLGAVDFRGIHQASHGGKAEAQRAAGAESVAKGCFDIRNPGSLIDRSYADA